MFHTFFLRVWFSDPAVGDPAIAARLHVFALTPSGKYVAWMYVFSEEVSPLAPGEGEKVRPDAPGDGRFVTTQDQEDGSEGSEMERVGSVSPNGEPVRAEFVCTFSVVAPMIIPQPFRCCASDPFLPFLQPFIGQR